MLGLDLGDIQARNLKPGMLQHVILNLFIGSVVQDAGHIHILQGEFYPDALAGYLTLGKSKYRLDVARVVLLPNHTADTCIHLAKKNMDTIFLAKGNMSALFYGHGNMSRNWKLTV